MATASERNASARLQQSKILARSGSRNRLSATPQKNARTTPGSGFSNAPRLESAGDRGKLRAPILKEEIRPVSNEEMYQDQNYVAELQRKQTNDDFIARENRARIERSKASRLGDFHAYLSRAKSEANQHQETAPLQNEYDRLQSLLNNNISAKKRQRAVKKMSLLAKQMSSKTEELEKVKKGINLMFQGGAVGSTVDWPGETGWIATFAGGAVDTFIMGKTILNIDTVFSEHEPDKLDLSKFMSYVVIIHTGFFFVIFVGIIFTTSQFFFAQFGAILLGIQALTEYLGPFGSMFKSVLSAVFNTSI
ncbi:hypothetical protein COY25_04355 [Candidatus Uhrbacteria bacterium CG_4_10_14_0_2_um_filter_41_7]|uniref:Uncharacterized protein n=1 Tax=Candidatus Uhrbacteria bacterium CG_4_9_14_3_um_filter_41_35 TaxID=1975034 RepID=A0A2M7XE05_9BACT|nr:MAG: hypothetical protein COV92_00130 [Candidatus Uhrbacteria bacterium CG11_big_fil_rev_8_21_14_0_20_41_9]PIZ52985.1 MAG: hypothetical protein COY25_04355 [Candidatus Uhrbacteria bacterium CG_4_10_14_0_2_um_filter_41_7]PJA45956.1 MAG: hypothetical protein CO173_04115 [Candidatus Uhrbacteria bacterium CG_4_9_14_3_um_filter_41_35]